VWFARQGGWMEDAAVDAFLRYVEAVLPLLDGVELVCTINEPNMVSVLADPEVGFPAVGLPPGVPHVTDRLIAAHRGAVELVRSAGARAGWSVATQAYQPEPGAEQVAEEYGASREDVFLDAAEGDDWVGVQAYTRTRIGPDGPLPIPESAERTLTGWEYYPAAVGEGIRNAWRRAAVPVYVTENGIATDDDARRIDYTTGALQAVHACLEDGIDVRGYLHWSALDNYEWGSYRPRFGLIAWDRETFERHPKPSLEWLGRIAQANALPAS
jgi:beta-glucosidase